MRVSVFLACLVLLSCTEAKGPQPDADVGTEATAPEPVAEVGIDPAWTDQQRADYEQCLQDNMAVATAWEVIQQQCAASVSGEDDPLGEN